MPYRYLAFIKHLSFNKPTEYFDTIQTQNENEVISRGSVVDNVIHLQQYYTTDLRFLRKEE